MYIHMYAYTYTYVYMYIYTCIHLYVYLHSEVVLCPVTPSISLTFALTHNHEILENIRGCTQEKAIEKTREGTCESAIEGV